MTLTKSSVILTRRRIDIEYAEICKDIIIGHAELERQRTNLRALNLNPISAALLYHRFLSYENNDAGDFKKITISLFLHTTAKERNSDSLKRTRRTEVLRGYNRKKGVDYSNYLLVKYRTKC